MVICRPKMANSNSQRVPDLAENGPFAFQPHKEFINKNPAFILENLEIADPVVDVKFPYPKRYSNN